MYVEQHEWPELTGHRLADSGGLLDGHVSEGRARWGVREKGVNVHMHYAGLTYYTGIRKLSMYLKCMRTLTVHASYIHANLLGRSHFSL